MDRDIAMNGSDALIWLSSKAQLYQACANELQRVVHHPSRASYRAWLSRQHAVIAPLERALAMTPGLGKLVDLRARRKAARLRADLDALGAESSSRASTFVPVAFFGAPAALGWMYAVERATLQFDDAYRRLARALPTEMAVASAYLRCYDGHANVMWRSLASSIHAACASRAQIDELIASAESAFRCLRGSQQLGADLDPFVHRSIAK